MKLKKARCIKLNSGLVSKLDDIRDPDESYSASISKLIDIADLIDAKMPAMRDLK